MAQDKQSMRWRVIGHSVRGATHERREIPNQDAIHWLPQSAPGSPLILAVADGHGSHRSFRSERGARLAVLTAAEVVSEFLGGQTQSMSAIRRAAEEWLPVALVRRWLAAVADDLTAHPLSTDELDLLGRHPARAAAEEGPTNLQVAYGTTLLATTVTDSFVLYLQLGDGEILTVSPEGEVLRPLPKDERLFANETTSLCSEDAWRDFRVCFQVFTNAPPALILLSTDGYPNSFRDERGFLKVGPDILEMIRTVGLDTVNEQIPSWLTESTYAGSGDDITLGLICSEDAVGPGAAPEQGSLSSGQSATRQQLKQHKEIDAPVEYEV